MLVDFLSSKVPVLILQICQQRYSHVYFIFFAVVQCLFEGCRVSWQTFCVTEIYMMFFARMIYNPIFSNFNNHGIINKECGNTKLSTKACVTLIHRNVITYPLCFIIAVYTHRHTHTRTHEHTYTHLWLSVTWNIVRKQVLSHLGRTIFTVYNFVP